MDEEKVRLPKFTVQGEGNAASFMDFLPHLLRVSRETGVVSAPSSANVWRSLLLLIFSASDQPSLDNVELKKSSGRSGKIRS